MGSFHVIPTTFLKLEYIHCFPVHRLGTIKIDFLMVLLQVKSFIMAVFFYLLTMPHSQGRAIYHISKSFKIAASKLEKVGYGMYFLALGKKFFNTRKFSLRNSFFREYVFSTFGF